MQPSDPPILPILPSSPSSHPPRPLILVHFRGQADATKPHLRRSHAALIYRRHEERSAKPGTPAPAFLSLLFPLLMLLVLLCN